MPGKRTAKKRTAKKRTANKRTAKKRNTKRAMKGGVFDDIIINLNNKRPINPNHIKEKECKSSNIEKCEYCIICEAEQRIIYKNSPLNHNYGCIYHDLFSAGDKVESLDLTKMTEVTDHMSMHFDTDKFYSVGKYNYTDSQNKKTYINTNELIYMGQYIKTEGSVGARLYGQGEGSGYTYKFNDNGVNKKINADNFKISFVETNNKGELLSKKKSLFSRLVGK
jgi:hypothetical protein